MRVLDLCRAEITTPVPSKRHDDEAVLCWWRHVTGGYPIKAVPGALKDQDGQPLLAGRWANPDKTVRERMWAATEWRSPKVTLGALDGYSRIVKRWEEEFGVTLGERPPTATMAVDVRRGDDAEFMGDVVGVNGRVSRPRERFKKSWRIRNTGTVLWRRRSLTREGATSTGGLKTPPRVRIGETAAGCECRGVSMDHSPSASRHVRNLLDDDRRTREHLLSRSRRSGHCVHLGGPLRLSDVAGRCFRCRACPTTPRGTFE